MIKNLALTNFKSIGKTLIVNNEEITESKLEFAPLTIFCGKNSSGKSTVLQSILLLTQTLQNNVQLQTLVLNGPMIKLGSIDDIKSEFLKTRDISINIDFVIPRPSNDTDSFKYSKCLLSKDFSDDDLNKIFNVQNILSKLSLDEEERINKNTNLFISFFNKYTNDISNLIPVIKQLHFKDEYIINDNNNSVIFSASDTNKFKNINASFTNY